MVSSAYSTGARSTCGDIHWWNALDLKGLRERHGQAEHLVVQYDFCQQAWLGPRAEFSVPGASKSLTGRPGYIDVAATAKNEIWEIKPRHLKDKAASEANYYLSKVRVACGANWRLGTEYQNMFHPDPVWQTWGPGGSIRAELFAVQGGPGTILYYWTFNGKEDPVLQRNAGWILRGMVVTDYFGRMPTLLPGASAPPVDLPPLRWKPLQFAPGFILPELQTVSTTLLKTVAGACCPRVPESGAVAVLVSREVFDAITGPGNMARQIGLMQVQRDPVVALYRETLLTLTSVLGIPGAILLGYGLGQVVEVGGAVLAMLSPVASGVALVEAATLPAEVAAFVTALRVAVAGAVRPAVAAGASMLAFALPRAALADPTRLSSIVPSLPMFKLIKFSERQLFQVRQPIKIDGAEWFVVALATAVPG